MQNRFDIVDILSFYFSELCWGKVMVVYTKPRQRKKEESERLRGERDQIMLIDPGFEKWQVVRFRKARRQDVPYIACSRDDLWDVISNALR